MYDVKGIVMLSSLHWAIGEVGLKHDLRTRINNY
jgi:hypothetical protein